MIKRYEIRPRRKRGMNGESAQSSGGPDGEVPHTEPNVGGI